MRIVVAPSGFKESLGAEAAADAIAEGVLRVVPFAEIDRVPLVDGGEGSAAALAGSTGGKVVDTVVTGPIGLLAAALDNWAEVLRRDLGADVALAPGSGASGGLGAGLRAALGARLLPRFEVLLDHVDLDARLAAADLVVTAEGTIDAQTPHGKVPAEVARRAKAHGKPVIALAGRIGMDADTTYAVGIDAFQAIQPGPVDLDEAILRGAEFLTDAAERMLRIVLVGTRLSAPVM